MGPVLFFLTSLKTVAKQNQLVRFRMASTAAAVNAVRLPSPFRSPVFGADRTLPKQFRLKDPSLIRTQGLINGKWVDGEEGGKITVTSSTLLPS